MVKILEIPRTPVSSPQDMERALSVPAALRTRLPSPSTDALRMNMAIRNFNQRKIPPARPPFLRASGLGDVACNDTFHSWSPLVLTNSLISYVWKVSVPVVACTNPLGMKFRRRISEH